MAFEYHHFNHAIGTRPDSSANAKFSSAESPRAVNRAIRDNHGF